MVQVDSRWMNSSFMWDFNSVCGTLCGQPNEKQTIISLGTKVLWATRAIIENLEFTINEVLLWCCLVWALGKCFSRFFLFSLDENGYKYLQLGGKYSVWSLFISLLLSLFVVCFCYVLFQLLFWNLLFVIILKFQA